MTDPSPVEALRAAPGPDLDPEQIGNALVSLLASSAALGHARPGNTLRYVRRGVRPEVEFVRDMMKMSTDEIADKWFGGRAALAAVHSRMTSGALGLRERT